MLEVTGVSPASSRTGSTDGSSTHPTKPGRVQELLPAEQQAS
jgi:hypothetical protein